MEDTFSPVFNVGIYARLSVDHHRDSIQNGTRSAVASETSQAAPGHKNDSVYTQIAMAKAYLEKHEDMVLYDCYIDIGRTGTNFHRAGFERLMKDIRDKKVNCIIVKDLSRLGRNYIETGDYLERIFPLLGVRFISLTDGMDSLCSHGSDHLCSHKNHRQYSQNSDSLYPQGSDSLGIELKNLINELYATDISLKVKSTKQLKLEQGSYTGGLPPYGYLLRFCNGRKILSENPEPADMVRTLFARYAGGESLSGLVRWLYRSQVHRPSEYHRYGHVYRQEGEILRQWSPGSIRKLLSNPVYLKGCVAEKILFDQVQERLGRGTEQRMEQGPNLMNDQDDSNHEVPGADFYKSILYCGSCGRRLHRSCGRGRNSKNVYSCCYSARLDELRCNTKSISSGKLTGLLNKVIEMECRIRGIGPGELGLWAEEEKERRLRENELKMAELERSLRSEHIRVSELYRRYRQGLAALSDYQKAKAGSNERVNSLKEQLKMLEYNKIESGKGQRLNTQDGKGAAFEMLLRHLIKRIELYPNKRIKIYFMFNGL